MPLIKPSAVTLKPGEEIVAVGPETIVTAQREVAPPSVVQVAVSKDERISRQGAIQAACADPFLCSIAADVADHRRLASEQADWLLAWTHKQHQ